MDHGEQCVMMVGTYMMQLLSVECLGTQGQQLQCRVLSLDKEVELSGWMMWTVQGVKVGYHTAHMLDGVLKTVVIMRMLE